MQSRFILAAMAVMIAVSGSAYSQEKRDRDSEDWEKVEEPALRPYKALFRGFRALGHHTVQSLADGNEKVPILGSIEVFRGVRRGAVEIVSGTYMGMAGSKPKEHTAWSKPNIIIESDPLLSATADFATPVAIGNAASGAETAFAFGAGVFAGQKVLDSDPLADRKLEDEDRAEDRVADAQKRFIGDRAETNKKENGTGNLLKLARDK